MRRYLYFDMADAPQMQKRLDRLADRGLELMSTDGFFSGEFERTTRGDLRYLVLPYGNASHFPRSPEHYDRFGYRLMGGFNGMAIFKPLPCADCDPEGLRTAFREDGCLHEHPWGVLLSSLLGLAAAAIIFMLTADRLLKITVLTSYPLLALLIFLAVLALGSLADLFTLRSYAGGWLHGSTRLANAACLLLILVGVLLSQRGVNAAFAVMSIGCAIALFCGFWSKNRAVSAVCAGVFLAVLLLGVLFPNVQRSDSTQALHLQAQSLPVLQLDDYWPGEDLRMTELSTDGTFLIHTCSYTEIGSEHSLSCTAYCCATAGMANRLMDYFSRTQPAYTAGDSKALLQEGKIVWLIDGSDTLPSRK